MLSRNLTVEEVGLFFAIFSFIDLLNLGRSFGINHSVVKFIPEYVYKKRDDLVNRSIFGSFIFMMVLSLFLSLVVVLFANALAEYYFQVDVSKSVLYILLGFFVLTTVYQSQINYFLGRQHFKYVGILKVLRSGFILLTISFFFYVLSSTTVVHAALGYLIGLLIVVIFFFRVKKFYVIFASKFDKALLKKHVIFGLPLVFVIISKTLLTNVDIMFLTFFSDLDIVGIYSLSVATGQTLTFFESSFISVLVPSISELAAKKKLREVRQILDMLKRYLVIGLIPLILGGMFFSPIVLSTLYGSEYVSGYLVFSIMCVAMLFWNIASVNLNACVSLGKPKFYAKSMYVGVIINIVLNAILIPLFSMHGAVISTLASYMVIFSLSNKYIKKVLPSKKKTLSLALVGIGACLYLCSIYILDMIFSINDIFVAIFACATSLGVYAMFLVLSKVIRKDEIQSVYRLYVKKSR